MEGKNILYICDYAAHYTGSFIASMSLLAKKAGERNQIFFLFPESAKGKRWLPMLPVDEDHLFFVDFSVKNLAVECKLLSRLLDPKNTIVHTHFVGDLRLLAVRSTFSNVICHYHMMVPMGPTLMKKIKRQVRRVIYRNLIIVGVSEAVREDAKEYFDKARCECVPNAVAFSILEHSSAASVVLKDKRPHEFRVLMHGSDFICKGVDVGIKAINELNREYPGEFKLYMTSNNVQLTKDQILEITDVTENIFVIQSVENIKSLYDSVDLYISPSREEAFSYAVVEASYSDCLVAASDIPGQSTMKPVPGILWFGKDDVQGLKNAVLQSREYIRNGKSLEIKEQQRAFVTQAFRIEEWVERNLTIYDKYFS